jgi:hypothetical protein
MIKQPAIHYMKLSYYSNPGINSNYDLILDMLLTDPSGNYASVFTSMDNAYEGRAIPCTISVPHIYNHHLVTSGDSLADRAVSLLFQNLIPGKYIAVISGAEYSNKSHYWRIIKISPSAVPVPAAIWLFGFAFACLIILRRCSSETA